MPIPLRTDFDAATLRAEARRTKHAGQARRLLSLAAVYEGATRTEAARIGGVTLQIVRDWVLRFNAEGPDALIGRKAPGKVSIRRRPQPAYSEVPRRLSSSGSALCISTSSRSVSMPKSVNAMTLSSPGP